MNRNCTNDFEFHCDEPSLPLSLAIAIALHCRAGDWFDGEVVDMVPFKLIVIGNQNNNRIQSETIAFIQSTIY